MIIKYNIDIDNEYIVNDIDRIINQTFKLLPCREEGGDWVSPLENLIVEISGFYRLTDISSIFCLLCKMEGLLILTDEDDFMKFRKGIFECLNLLSEVKKCLD